MTEPKTGQEWKEVCKKEFNRTNSHCMHTLLGCKIKDWCSERLRIGKPINMTISELDKILEENK